MGNAIIPDGFEHIKMEGNRITPCAESPLLEAVAEAIRYAQENLDKTVILSFPRRVSSPYGTPQIKSNELNLTQYLSEIPERVTATHVLSALHQTPTVHSR